MTKEMYIKELIKDVTVDNLKFLTEDTLIIFDGARHWKITVNDICKEDEGTACITLFRENADTDDIPEVEDIDFFNIGRKYMTAEEVIEHINSFEFA